MKAKNKEIFMTTQTNAWKALPWDCNYMVSQTGEIYSKKICRNMAVQINLHGYKYIGVKRNGIRKNFLIHRLIMELYGPPMPADKTHINHIDGNKLNNNLSNLEWCDRSWNMYHSTNVLGNPKPPLAKGKRGLLSKLSKPIIGKCIATGKIIHYESMRLADSDGFRIANVRASISKKVNHYKGYKWELV